MRIVILIIFSATILFSCGVSAIKYRNIEIADSKSNFNVKNVVLIDPFYVKNDFRKKSPTQHIESDDKTQVFINILNKNSKDQKVKLDIKNVTSVQKDEVEYYNDLLPLKNQILNSLIFTESKEKTTKYKYHRIKTPLTINKNNYLIDPEYSDLMTKYKTKYFALSGIIENVDKANISYPYLILLPPLGLLTLEPTRKSYYYFVVVNVESGEIIYQENRFHRDKMTDMTISTLVYDTFVNLKKI